MNDKVVLLDFWTDKNRGDAAMQLSIINLTKSKFPNDKITIITGYGANQIDNIKDELDLTNKKVKDGSVKEIVGGMKPTYFRLESNIANRFLITRIFFELLALFKSIILLFFLLLRVPKKFIRLFLRKKYRYTFDILCDAKIIIWNGRNFRGDTWIKEPYDIFNLLYNPLVGILLRKKIVNIGSSVWPLKNKLSRLMLKYAFKKCDLVTIRENNSYMYLKKISNKTDNIKLRPDLSFHLLKNLIADKNIVKDRTSNTIGLTVVDWNNDGNIVRERYIDSLIQFVRYLIGIGKEVLVIPQVTYKVEKTDRINNTLKSEFGDKIKFIDEDLDVEGLLKIYAKLELLIATRMHSSIFAQSLNVPAISIAYDHGGKWGILDMLNSGDSIISITDVTTDLLIDKYVYITKNRKSIQDKIESGANYCFANVDKNFEFDSDIS